MRGSWWAAIAICIACGNAGAGPAQVFELVNGQTDAGATHLDRLQSRRPVLRAILAMYALQHGGGCDRHDVSGLRCELTSSLGLGAQCSKRHIDTVRRAFAGGMPKLGGFQLENYARVGIPGVLESMCYQHPDTATFQSTWRSIRLSQDGDIVVVDADGDWLAREDDGQFETHAAYRLRGSVVTVLWSQRSVTASKPTFEEKH